VLRAVADTNIVVSALLWRGAPHRLFERLDTGAISLYTSASLLAELADVLPRRKLARAVRATGKSVPVLIAEYQSLARLVRPRPLPEPVSRDPDDDAVIACAIAARAHLIVSGDKDLRALGAFRAIRIATPAQALAFLS